MKSTIVETLFYAMSMTSRERGLVADLVTPSVMGAPLSFGFITAGGRGHLPSIDLDFVIIP